MKAIKNSKNGTMLNKEFILEMVQCKEYKYTLGKSYYMYNLSLVMKQYSISIKRNDEKSSKNIGIIARI